MKALSPRVSDSPRLVDQHAIQRRSMDHSHQATMRSSDRTTVISKSLNVAATNPAVNEQYSKLIDAIEEKVEADRTKVNPLKL